MGERGFQQSIKHSLAFCIAIPLFEKRNSNLAGKIVIPENYKPCRKHDPSDVDVDLLNNPGWSEIISTERNNKDPDDICTKGPKITNPYNNYTFF